MDFLESIIERSPLLLTPDLTVKMAIARLYKGHQRCGLVVAGEKVVGLVTERDLLGCVLNDEDCNQAQIPQVMTTPVMTVTEGTELSTIAALFQQHPIAYLPLVNPQGRPTGLIERREFLQRWETFNLDRQWRNRYELAEVASGQVLYEYDFAQDTIIWGANASRMFGYPPQDLPISRGDWQQLIHPEDRPKFEQEVQRVLQESKHFCLQYRWRHYDGRYIWIEDRNQLHQDPVNPLPHVVGMMADITAAKEAEERRRERDAQVQMMVSAQPAMLYTLVVSSDNKPRFTYIGTQAETVHEVTVAEILADAEVILGQIHPDDRAGYEAKVAASAANESMFCHEFRIITPSGQMKWLRAHSMPQHQPDGAIAWHGVGLDITEARQIQQDLTERENQLQEAQHIAQLGSWELDHQTRTLRWSAEFYRIFELDPATAEPHYDFFFTLLPPDEAERVEAAFQAHLQSNETFDLIHRLVLADGRVKYIRERGATEWNAQGQPIISRGTSQDVTSAYTAQMMLEKLVEGTAAVTGENFFLELVRYLAEALGVDYAIASERQGDNLRTLGYYVKGELVPNTTYAQAQTPCEKTLEQGEYVCDSRVQEKFPQDPDLASIKAESYLGMVLRDEQEQIIGHLCILDTKPLPGDQATAAMNVMRIFAARASVELQRIRAQRQLEELNRNLEARIAQRTQALQEVSQVQQAILDSTDYVVISTDETGIIKTFNAQAEKVFGYRAEEVIGVRRPFDFHDPQEMAQRAAELSQQLGRKIEPGMEIFLQDISQPILHQGEWTIIPKTGDRRILSLTLTPLKSAQQEIMGVLGVGKDITEEKRAEAERQRIEQALAESEVRLRCIFDSNVVGIMVCDFQGHIFQANDCFLEMVGYDREDLVNGGLNWRDLTPPEYLALDEAAIALLKTEGAMPPWEKAYIHRDGHIVHVLLGVAIVEETEESVCVVLDITQRKQAEQAFQRKALQEAMMREMTQRIRQTLDLQSIFETAATEVRKFLGVDRVAIFRFDPDSGYDDGEFVAESLEQGFDSVLAIRIHDHCFGEGYSQLYLRGHYQAIADVLNSNLQPCHVEILQRFQIRANLVMPLICGDRLWGLLCMHTCTGPRTWQEAEITLVQQMSVQLGIAIQQAAFYEQMQRELTVRQQTERELQEAIKQLQQSQTATTEANLLLQTISTAQSAFITTANRLEIFETLLEDILDLTDSEYGFIGEVLFRGDGSATLEESYLKIRGVPYLKTHSITNIAWDEETLKFYEENYEIGMEFTNMNSLFGAVIMTGKPVIANSPSTDPRRAGTPSGHPPLNAFLGLPFFRGEELVGMVGIANRPGGYEQQILEFLEPFLITCSNLVEGFRLDRQRREAQYQLQQTNQELLRVTRSKDEFLANMSHELRTPLNAILGNTEILQDEIFGDINAQQTRSLNIIETSANHLLSLINDILDLAKIESGQIELEMNALAIAPLCEASLGFIKQQAQKKKIQIQTHIEDNLPEILGDERRLRQVLINLLNNAVKFTPEGGTITLSATRINPENPQALPRLHLAIEDTGIGIAETDRAKLFKPFVQIDSALNRQYEGTGLGLALVKQVVEMHGGEVGLTSEVGVGSTFTVDLPYTPMTPDDDLEEFDMMDRDNASAPSDPTAPFPLVLLAEDNAANAEFIEDYLQIKGYRVVLATDGHQALALAQQEPPQIILMDIQMPRMDGLTAIHCLRQNPTLAKIPIIALTALSMDGDRERCLAAGANEYLSKPVRLKQLDTVIQALLANTQ